MFGLTQPVIIQEILGAQLKLTMEVERGTFIVPSFDEIWPNPNKVREKKLRRMGMEYILEVSGTKPFSHPRTIKRGLIN